MCQALLSFDYEHEIWKEEVCVRESEKDKRMRIVLKMQLQTEYNQRKSDLCVRESE